MTRVQYDSDHGQIEIHLVWVRRSCPYHSYNYVSNTFIVNCVFVLAMIDIYTVFRTPIVMSQNSLVISEIVTSLFHLIQIHKIFISFQIPDLRRSESQRIWYFWVFIKINWNNINDKYNFLNNLISLNICFHVKIDKRNPVIWRVSL